MELELGLAALVVGLAYDIPTVQELVDRIMQEADSLIAQRLSNLHGVNKNKKKGYEIYIGTVQPER